MAAYNHIIAPYRMGTPSPYMWFREPLEEVWDPSPNEFVSTAFWRIGVPAALNAARGKTVRGYRIKGELEFGTRDAVEMAGFYKVLPHQPSWTIPRTLGYPDAVTTFDIHTPDTGLPLGKFPEEGSWHLVADDEWAGLFSLDYVNSVGEGELMARLKLQEFSVVLDNTPTWTLNIPSAVLLLDQIEAVVTMKWPGGEPVVGESVTLLAGSVTRVRFGDQPWTSGHAVGVTDNDGIVRFEVQGEQVGADLLRIHLTDTDRWEFYTEVFNRTVSVQVVPATWEPGQPVCHEVPAQEFVPGTLPHYVTTPVFAWNAGANSITIVEEDAQLTFTMGLEIVGAVLGLAPATETLDSTDRNRITHGFFFNLDGVQIFEAGELRGQRFQYTDTTVFKVTRAGGTVAYYVDDTRLLISRVPSTGALVAATSLYATGDKVD